MSDRTEIDDTFALAGVRESNVVEVDAPAKDPVPLDEPKKEAEPPPKPKLEPGPNVGVGYQGHLYRMPTPPKNPQPILSIKEIKSIATKQCHNCKKFTKLVLASTNDYAPGVYCTYHTCMWCEPLPGRIRYSRSWMDIIGNDLACMVKKAPHNAQLRAAIHAAMLKPVPHSCITYEDIALWIGVCAELSRSGESDEPFRAAEDRVNGITATVFMEYEQSGTCCYSRKMGGQSEYTLDQEEIDCVIRSIHETRGSLADLVYQLQRTLNDKCCDDPPGSSPLSGVTTSDHDPCEADDYSYDSDRNAIRSAAVSWMERNRPAQLEEIMARSQRR